jgi:hypothetical protein
MTDWLPLLVFRRRGKNAAFPHLCPIEQCAICRWLRRIRCLAKEAA